MGYNRHKYDVKFKYLESKLHLEEDALKNIDKADYKIKFTLEKLYEHRDPFNQYIKDFGPELPVHTRYPLINDFGNKLASKTHYIRTNQPYANQVRKVIDQALEDNENIKQKARAHKKLLEQEKKLFGKKPNVRNETPVDLAAEETKIVIEALERIKDIHNDMVSKNIPGDVRKAIENIFIKFHADIHSSELIFKIPYQYRKPGTTATETITVTIKPNDIITKLNIVKERPLSPLVIERMLGKQY